MQAEIDRLRQAAEAIEVLCTDDVRTGK